MVGRSLDSPQDADRRRHLWRRHLGLYAYRRDSLEEFSSTAPTPLEQTEHLEQLRFLESGKRIAIARASYPIPAGVDTPEDLERVRSIISKLL